MAQVTCSVGECERKVLAGGLCGMHYQRLANYGSTDDPRPTTEQRFWGKVDKDGPIPSARPELGPCWVWTGATSDGYGRVGIRRGTDRPSTEGAHRISYRMNVGPIPEGLTLDHLCRNPPCVNPAHLEAVTMRENVLRGETITAYAASRTHCPQGHEYNEANTYRYKGTNHRLCRVCNRERARRVSLARRSSVH